jgi:hypothetical protein
LLQDVAYYPASPIIRASKLRQNAAVFGMGRYVEFGVDE